MNKSFLILFNHARDWRDQVGPSSEKKRMLEQLGIEIPEQKVIAGIERILDQHFYALCQDYGRKRKWKITDIEQPYWEYIRMRSHEYMFSRLYTDKSEAFAAKLDAYLHRTPTSKAPKTPLEFARHRLFRAALNKYDTQFSDLVNEIKREVELEIFMEEEELIKRGLLINRTPVLSGKKTILDLIGNKTLFSHLKKENPDGMDKLAEKLNKASIAHDERKFPEISQEDKKRAWKKLLKREEIEDRIKREHEIKRELIKREQERIKREQEMQKDQDVD